MLCFKQTQNKAIVYACFAQSGSKIIGIALIENLSKHLMWHYCSFFSLLQSNTQYFSVLFFARFFLLYFLHHQNKISAHSSRNIHFLANLSKIVFPRKINTINLPHSFFYCQIFIIENWKSHNLRSFINPFSNTKMSYYWFDV